MISPTRVGLVYLAAGRSQRFGDNDKLAEFWRGKPLARHGADILSDFSFGAHLAVVSKASDLILPPQFEPIVNQEPELGLSRSIALGVSSIEQRELDACLIALADMPLVPRTQFNALLAAFDADSCSIVATGCQGRTQVPAMFAREHFGSLQSLSGDKGARGIMTGAHLVECEPALLADFDQPRDFRD